MTAVKIPVSNALTAQEVMRKLRFDPALLNVILSGYVQRRMYDEMLIDLYHSNLFTRGRRILGAYTDDRPFSVELVGAVSSNIPRFLRFRDPV